MRQIRAKISGAAICALLFTVPLGAAAKATSETRKPTPAAAKSMRTAWPPETLTGKIMEVDAARRLVVVEGPGDVPYDMKVNRSTKIISGEQPVKLDSLSANQPVEVRFTPERSGDIAQLIQVKK